MSNDSNFLRALATQLRVDSIRCTTAAGSGHPTSSMSAAELMAVLMTDYLRYDWDDPHSLGNDRLIFSKGHASPLLYSMYKAAGVISDEELLSLRKFGSRLEGHPKPLQKSDDGADHGLPWVDVATGSLGQGLPTAVGMGLVGRHVDHLPFHLWVLLGDSEMAEGSVWEAFDKAAFYGLGNITAILDMNRLGQRGPTEFGWHGQTYADRARAFGWHAIEIAGHDIEQIDAAYREASGDKSKPTLIVARTVKGYGVSFLANEEGWHGKALSEEQRDEAIAELGGEHGVTVQVQKRENPAEGAKTARSPEVDRKTYELGTKESTRKAFGDALVELGKGRSDLIVLDGEVANSTYADAFQKTFPNRFFEIYIAEQQMISAAVGMSVLGKRAVAATFAAFLSRAFDQIRMAAVSGANLSLCGSHVGVSIGEDGPSQMGLEDIATMRTVLGSTILYPCDPNQAAWLTELMLDLPGISYLRTTREKLPTLYSPDEQFAVGGSKTLRSSDNDQATILAAGVTVHEAIKACDTLRSEGVDVRVIDLYSVKPIDRRTLERAASETHGLIVVEDHWVEGGLGDAVLEALSCAEGELPRVTKLAVREMPGSGTPAELMHAAGIDAEAIVQAVRTGQATKPPAKAVVL